MEGVYKSRGRDFFCWGALISPNFLEVIFLKVGLRVNHHFSKISGFSRHPKGRTSTIVLNCFLADFQGKTAVPQKSLDGLCGFLTFAGETQLFFPVLPCFQTLL